MFINGVNSYYGIMARHLVVKDEIGCVVEDIAELEKRDIGITAEILLLENPRFKEAYEKIRKGKK